MYLLWVLVLAVGAGAWTPPKDVLFAPVFTAKVKQVQHSKSLNLTNIMMWYFNSANCTERNDWIYNGVREQTSLNFFNKPGCFGGYGYDETLPPGGAPYCDYGHIAPDVGQGRLQVEGQWKRNVTINGKKCMMYESRLNGIKNTFWYYNGTEPTPVRIAWHLGESSGHNEYVEFIPNFVPTSKFKIPQPCDN
eukprot:TRINITY_DN66271_c6_g2_i1.p1 TRINITY_DN66271_c6_g2~~TRINITY_DN66271_c6_g2_i1.p1  ORF type:complete len:192 (-),score=21.39 TRINITY_DN66271_c6_g2_i1:135-710(-)